MKIKKLNEKHYQKVLEIWETSVRATHHFLQEKDIVFYRSVGFQALKKVDLYGLWDESNSLIGFIGIHGEMIELLFLHPTVLGKGFGKLLVEYAFSIANIRFVDVNEQNETAFGFYRKMGFEVISREATDNWGKPYPILHLAIKQVIEKHPLGFFLPENTQLLMLGSFPPPQQRWSMNFYYPNIQNDMWRILGYLFFNDKDYFLESSKKFSEQKCKDFCRNIGLGIGDTGVEVIRQKGNASDKFLEIVKPIDMENVLEQIPQCKAIVVTGQKAMDTLLGVLSQLTLITEPKVGEFSSFILLGRKIKLFRMPSSSRAYPKPLVEKATIYRHMFEILGMLP